MDKYIHIEDLKNYLNRQIRAFEPCPDKYDAAVGIYDGIYQIPAADVVPVRHGQWINFKWKSLTTFSFECNQCGITITTSLNYNFCPNCGAKMDKDGNGE